MLDILHLRRLIEEKDAPRISEYMKEHNLTLSDENKIIKINSSFEEDYAFWDKRQLIKKINLNS
jgi:histidinol phosphatase-like PHP family hydrolase